jgi:twinkle protein
MKVKRINDVTEQLFDLHKNNTSNLLSTGFKTLDEYYQIRPSNTTIIYGFPSAGKSEFALQLLIGLTVKYGKKHLIYTPETGTAEEIFSEIAHSLTGKTFDKRFPNYITEAEIYKVQPFIQEYFSVIEDDGTDGLSLENYFEIAREVKRDKGLDCTLLDNFNDLQHSASDLNNIAAYLPIFLPKWNKFSKIENLHSFMICHARNPTGVKSGELPKPPSVYEINGGQAWYAKAQSLICIDRPYEEINGYMQQSNTVDVDIKKIKPKIVGKKGVVKLDFEFSKKCYSETIDGLIHTIDTGFKTSYQVPSETKIRIGEKIAVQSSFDLPSEDNDIPF